MSTIVELRAANVKRLVAVTVKPDGSLVVVGGRNGQGKTSLLDSIAYAIGGKDLVPAEPLRRGEKHGEVEIKLDDGMVIKRTFTPGGGGAVTVAAKDGARYPSPQKLLDGLTGKLSFDPLAFSRMDPKTQAQTLRALVGMDLSAIDAKAKAAYDARTDVNREAKRLEGALTTLPAVPDGTPDVEVSIEELAKGLEARRAHNASITEERRRLEDFRRDAIATKDRIAKLEMELEQHRADLKTISLKGKEQAEKVASMLPANEAEVLDKLKDIQSINAAVRVAAERKKLETELEAQREKAIELTGQITDAEDEKREKLAAAKMPIDGLAFTDAGVTLNGIALEQASSAEQLRTSVAIGLAMHPKLKVLLVRDGSLLDEQSLAMVADMAEKAGAQVWCERVSNGEECSVIIEDGQVIAEQPKAKRGQAALPMSGREPGADG